MSNFKSCESKEYLQKINQTVRKPKQYYTALIEKIANCLKTSSEPADSIILCDESPDGKNWFNNIFDKDCKPVFPLTKYIVVNFSAGYWPKKECLGSIVISKEFHELLLSEGWKFNNPKSSFEYQYELSLE